MTDRIYVEKDGYTEGVRVTIHISDGSLNTVEESMLIQNIEIAICKVCQSVDINGKRIFTGKTNE